MPCTGPDGTRNRARVSSLRAYVSVGAIIYNVLRLGASRHRPMTVYYYRRPSFYSSRQRTLFPSKPPRPLPAILPLFCCDSAQPVAFNSIHHARDVTRVVAASKWIALPALLYRGDVHMSRMIELPMLNRIHGFEGDFKKKLRKNVSSLGHLVRSCSVF